MAEKQKRKPKPPKKMTKAEQSERFKETARKHGVDESGETFERAFRKIVPPRWRSKGDPQDDQGAAKSERFNRDASCEAFTKNRRLA
jgi:hypothetical protein